MTSKSRMWRSICAGVRRIGVWPFRVAAARATLRALAKMDRRELADIGLTSCDLRDVSALPLDGDPTELLSRRVRERQGDSFGLPSSLRLGGGPLDDPDDLSGRNRPPSRPKPKPAGQGACLVRTG